MKHLTIRNVDPQLARALERARHESGKSLNHTVLELLRRALGVRSKAEPGNGLAEQAGGWSEEEFRAFEEATAEFDRIDHDLWR